MKSTTVFLHTDGRWNVSARGFDTQEDAIAAARPLSKALGGEFVIHGEDGQIREKDSHGHDPEEIRG